MTSRADAEAEAKRLRLDPDVEWVIVNELEQRQSMAPPSDPDFAIQTWLHPTSDFAAPNISNAWQRLVGLGRPLSPVVVAVLDTGVLRHPDLVGRVLYDDGYDFVASTAYSNDGDSKDADATDPGDYLTDDQIASSPANYQVCGKVHDSSWHGTMVAGQLAAATNNGLGGAGMLFQLDGPPLLPVRVAGNCGAAVSDIIEGMMWAAGVSYAGMPKVNRYPARVLNLSFGGVSDTCTCVLTNGKPTSAACLYQEAIRAITQRGAVLIAAAGNANSTDKPMVATPSRPANCPGVLAVSALHKDGAKAQYSYFASSRGLSTLGGDKAHGDPGIYSTSNSGTTIPVLDGSGAENAYKTEVGTSFSAPIVSGTVAMMLAVNPGLSVTQVLNGLRTKGVKHFPAEPPPAAGDVASDVPAGPETLFPTVKRDGKPLPLCTPAETGACNCTAESCGAGILDASLAVAWAIEQPLTSYAPSEVTANFYNVQGSPAPAPVDGQKAGGGGSIDGLDLVALMLCLAVMRARRHLP